MCRTSARPAGTSEHGVPHHAASPIRAPGRSRVAGCRHARHRAARGREDLGSSCRARRRTRRRARALDLPPRFPWRPRRGLPPRRRQDGAAAHRARRDGNAGGCDRRPSPRRRDRRAPGTRRRRGVARMVRRLDQRRVDRSGGCGHPNGRLGIRRDQDAAAGSRPPRESRERDDHRRRRRREGGRER